MSRKKTTKKQEVEESESDNGEEVYTVEKILDKKTIGSKVHYLVKWKGYPLSEATWEPLENLSNALDLIREFRRHEFKSVVDKNYSVRVRSVIHAEKKDGTIYYTIVDKNDQLKQIPSSEARRICPQKIIDYYSENFQVEEGEEKEEEEAPKEKEAPAAEAAPEEKEKEE